MTSKYPDRTEYDMYAPNTLIKRRLVTYTVTSITNYKLVYVVFFLFLFHLFIYVFIYLFNYLLINSTIN